MLRVRRRPHRQHGQSACRLSVVSRHIRQLYGGNAHERSLRFYLATDASCKSVNSGYNELMKPRPTGPRYLDIDLRPYVGKYIALVEGRVAAVADTPRGAFSRARRTRPRRMPVIIKVVEPDRLAHMDYGETY